MKWGMILMNNNTEQNNTIIGTNEKYQVTQKDLNRTAARYNFMACNIFNYESQQGPQ